LEGEIIMLKKGSKMYLITSLILLIIIVFTGCSNQSKTEQEPLSMATSVDFLERKDGIPGLEEKYGFKFDRNALKTMQIGLTYQALDSKKVDVAMGYATDGRISAMDLRVLEDDLGYFPVYNPTPVIRVEILDEYPELSQLINKLPPLLDQSSLIELNNRADIEGEEPDKIAEDFLKNNGLLTESSQEKKGVTISVASKPWTEQLILGNMTVQLLKNHGYQVKDRTSLGSTAVLRSAIETDEIDLYWEYTGTTLMTTMGSKEVVVDPEEAYNRVREWDKKNGIIWLDYAAANNTYCLLMKEEKAAELGLSTISDLAQYINN